jgi:hypothetical protein
MNLELPTAGQSYLFQIQSEDLEDCDVQQLLLFHSLLALNWGYSPVAYPQPGIASGTSNSLAYLRHRVKILTTAMCNNVHHHPLLDLSRGYRLTRRSPVAPFRPILNKCTYLSSPFIYPRDSKQSHKMNIYRKLCRYQYQLQCEIIFCSLRQDQFLTSKEAENPLRTSILILRSRILEG